MLYRFADYTFDTGRRELRRTGALVRIEPQVFDILEYLLRHRNAVVTKDDLLTEIWNGRIVSDSALTTRINAVRKAIGDNGSSQQFIRTIPRKGVRFVGDVDEESPSIPPPPTLSSATARTPNPDIRMPTQQIHYCHADDGVRIAFAVAGKGPRLFKAANYLNHLEYDWASPVTSHLLRKMASRFTLARYDARGTGLSDWEVADISFEAWVRDLETVVDAVGWKRFPLMGMSQGCAVAIAYAVRHPERVSHLILYGGFARGGMARATTDTERDRLNAMETLTRFGWGERNPAFRQIFTSQFVPDGTKEQIDWFNEQQRRTTSPDCAARYFRTVINIDVQNLLPMLRVPTLVLHLLEDAVVRFDCGREIAAGIRGARFVPLIGRNHMPLPDDPAASGIPEEIRRFLGQ